MLSVDGLHIVAWLIGRLMSILVIGWCHTSLDIVGLLVEYFTSYVIDQLFTKDALRVWGILQLILISLTLRQNFILDMDFCKLLKKSGI